MRGIRQEKIFILPLLIRFVPGSGLMNMNIFLDLRKILKFSVSRILAIAVNKYLPANDKEKMNDDYH